MILGEVLQSTFFNQKSKGKQKSEQSSQDTLLFPKMGFALFPAVFHSLCGVDGNDKCAKQTLRVYDLRKEVNFIIIFVRGYVKVNNRREMFPSICSGNFLPFISSYTTDI